MRSLSGNAITQVAEHYGNEPIAILDIAWTVDGATRQYADRDVTGIEGKILEISSLDNVIKISQSDDSQEITAILDDTNGTIKAIMDANDIHKRDVWVYQHLEGLNLADRFLLFKGKINSPIIWSEGEQTVQITIVSQLEDKEVGFSPEEGQFPAIPRELIGKTWPSIFGTPLDVPAVQINKAVVGSTLCPVGIITGQDEHIAEYSGSSKPDVTIAWRRANYCALLNQIFRRASSWYGISNPRAAQEFSQTADDYLDQERRILSQIAETFRQYRQQDYCSRLKRQETVDNAEARGLGCNPVRILGGEDFPRGTITLNISNGLFTGHFEGLTDSFVIESRYHPEHAAEVATSIEDRLFAPRSCQPVSPKMVEYMWDTKVPAGYGNVFFDRTDTIYRMHFFHRPKTTSTQDKIDQIMRHFWTDAGSVVHIEGDEPITYIVSIVPGTVLQVKAFKTFNGIKRLINVPSNMWTASTQQYGSITAVQVTINKTLSVLEEQNWSDDLYVTFESDIGPNTIDILTYLIQTYTDLSIDATSFTAVKTKLTPFPANFALLERKNILEVLEEMAFQSRCNLRLVNGVFFLTYLAEEPSTVDTITESDIENQSIEVSLTSTEDLVTKYTALWRISYAQDDLNQIVLRHNVKKYGTQEADYEYYMYNQPDIIHKIATFWLIRMSNTWKRIKFRTFFTKLALEAFDAILLDFNTPYVASSDVKAIIESASINGENYTISMECWLPVKSGEMSAYEFAWPAGVSADWIFPTDREVDLGLDGGDGIGRNATGNLPIGDISGVNVNTIYVGGMNVIFGPQTDRGDRYPSDQGFIAQSLNIDTTLANVIVMSMPSLNLLLNYTTSVPSPELPEALTAPFEIILETTPIISEKLPGNASTLSDILGLTKDDNLVIKIDANFRGEDGDCQIAPFDFKYDTVGGVWGAGTAFLREDSSTPPTPKADCDD